MKEFILNSTKGFMMGAANVIPGVSGGTIAVITGVFERLIEAISKFDSIAFKLLIKKDIKKLLQHIDFIFLLSLGTGAIISLISLAKLLDLLFLEHKLLVWAFFFGLILASVFAVGKTVRSWNKASIVLFIIGVVIAGSMVFLTPSSGNNSTFYLLLCGAVAMCSMILPGLSGSFILLLMGNYELIISSISQFKLDVLIPFGLGAILGILLFSKLLSLVFKNYHDQTISLLTGFIFGSLALLWPWKNEVINSLMIDNRVVEKVIGYTYTLPSYKGETLFALILIIVGALLILWTEKKAKE